MNGRIRFAIASALAVGVAIACGTSTTSGTSGTGGGPGTGMFAVQLVDAPNPAVKGIFVTIAQVTVHSNQAGWVNVFQ
ncbi:MAG TPA: hypothetical protein VK454_07020, partial [Myxococcaceae bacterium]|nr:hypothetical protein [Myxococcaceae bacterium]